MMDSRQHHIMVRWLRCDGRHRSDELAAAGVAVCRFGQLYDSGQAVRHVGGDVPIQTFMGVIIVAKSLHARLVAYKPFGDRLGVLAEPVSFSASMVHNDDGAISLILAAVW